MCRHKIAGGVIVILLIVMASYFLLRGNYQTPIPTVTEEEIEKPTEIKQLTTPTKEVSASKEAEVTAGQPTGELREFTITAKQFTFTPSTLTVNKGDRVRLSISDVDVKHGFAITEFGVNLLLTVGKTEIAQFVADKRGTFIFYCLVPCGSGHSTMKGQLIVK